MRFMLRSLVLTSAALCATAAFAAEKTVVNIPFNFQSRGEAFPAGRYDVSLDKNANVLTLRNASNIAQSMTWIATPADGDPALPVLRMTFDDAGNTRELHTVQLGTRITPVLDAPARNHGAGSSVAAGSGQ